jgi:hypothetical protein
VSKTTGKGPRTIPIDRVNVGQCDERKPICLRCEKGSRECAYPLSLKKSSKAKVVNTQPDSSSSGSDSESDFLDAEDSPVAIVKFTSASGHSPVDRDPFGELQTNQQTLVDSFQTRSSDNEHMFDLHASLLRLSEVGPNIDSGSIRQQSASPVTANDALCLPRSPRSNKSQLVQFFLKYHQMAISAAHYFRFYDYQQLSTKLLPGMADQSDALRHAMVAFSAFIYSMKVERAAREVAFLYYSVALRDLRSLLDKPSIGVDEYHTAVATALQLSAVDVFPLYFVVLIPAFLRRAL